MNNPSTFCILPWTSLHVRPNGSVYPCCVANVTLPVSTWQEDSLLEAAWNSESMRRIRLELLQGEQPKECYRCFFLEKQGIRSRRLQSLDRFEHLMPLVELTNADGSVDKMTIACIDMRFSNVCNLKCRTCGPELSSHWYGDGKKIGVQTKNTALIKPNLLPETKWSQIESILDQAEVIYFAGGEPLLTDEHYKILHWLVDHGKTDVEIQYNTNMSVLNFKGESVLDLWKRFNKLSIGASIDGYGSQAEYIRHGCVWEEIESNRRKMIEELPQVYFYVSATVSALSCSRLPDLQRRWVDNGLLAPNSWHLSFVVRPAHYHTNVLPIDFRKELQAKYLAHKNYMVQEHKINDQVQREWDGAIRFLEGDQMVEQLLKFKETTRALDLIRGESFVDVFPELAHIMKEESSK